MYQQGNRGKSNVVGVYRFMVELDGLIVGGFSEVSGLVVETEVLDVLEGGVNEYIHRVPVRTKHVPLSLKRGMTISNELWNWYADAVEGNIVRRSGSIILNDERDQEFRRWNFYDAFPTKWLGPELNAVSSEVAVEHIELTHNGFKLL